jgi:chorismate mutase / prephenate dehydratase
MILRIQWGRGSFNEQALQQYCREQEIFAFETKYLYTTHGVMEALMQGMIDYGVFAMVNSKGGLVQESLDAIGHYRFEVVSDVNLAIKHVLMCRKDIPRYEVTTIMAHPQVFSQCQETLQRHYMRYNLVSGEGDLIDTAKVAESLADGTLDMHIAVLGSRFLAELYDLQIMAENLQDRDDNMTRFLIIKN